MDKNPLVFVLLSAFLFGISPPFAKLFVKNIPPVALAGFLYLGAFIGLSLYSLGRKRTPNLAKTIPLVKKDLPWLGGAVISGGIIGPICLMLGLTLVSGFSASLLLNLEGVATALIAVLLFKENAGKRLWLALLCMTVAGIFLSWETTQNKFNLIGPVLIILAMVGWGIDNNLTRNISDKDPIQITQIKGLVAGSVSLALAFIFGMKFSLSITIVYALILGAFSYGLSLVFFIQALKGLGSARTGAFFSFAPFIGAITSIILLREWLGWVMFPATAFMILGVWLISSEKHSHPHLHKAITHTYSHQHNDMHHFHEHPGPFNEPHTHEHTHIELIHAHVHWPDTHHRHEHEKSQADEKHQ